MNYSDSERIAGVLELAGYEKTLSEDKADLIVINACSIRKSAVNRITGNFKKYKKYKKKNPNLKIVLTGCVLKSNKERFEKLFDAVISIEKINILGCHCKEALATEAIPKLRVKNLSTGLPHSLSVARNDSYSYFDIKPLYQSKFTAYVPIMTGCDNFCSYCVVPHTRGREYSRVPEKIIDEITELVKKGYKEIILLGQNVNSYESNYESGIRNQESGISNNASKHTNSNNNSNPTNWIPASAGMTGKVDFPKLLKLINNISGNFWIRFLTSHPKDMTEELIKTLAECEKVTPHVHLALQSGDDEILKKMNRKYTAKHFLNLVELIRKYLPNATITTDVIVGFPTESETQFQRTAEIMKKAKFDMVYINKYSPREGTESYKIKDNVSWEEKKERERILTKILKETALENNQKYVGKVVEVLIDKVSDDHIYGKTESFKDVKIENTKRLYNSKTCPILRYGRVMESTKELVVREGEFVKVKIAKAKFWNLEGKIVK